MSDGRQPAVAGQFYEGTAEGLTRQLEQIFSHEHGPGTVPTPASCAPTIRALVSPHAGYPYSGPVAAHGFGALAEDGTPDAVVLVGPNHSGRGETVAVSAVDEWRTPLGSVPVHDGLRTRLLERSDILVEDDRTHAGEHSIEVQVPFLQYLYEDPVPIVPICMTRQDGRTATALADAIGATIDGVEETVVVVASTDLTHYEPQAVAEAQDQKAIDRMVALDADGLLETVASEDISMCGYGPTAVALETARRLGAETGELLHYATSGDTSGPSREVVGYASLALG